MRLIVAFFKLIRLPNLIFIALTQLLFYYCILLPLLKPVGAKVSLDETHFFLLILASVLIAAAGYVINDYFDVDIDQVNRPRKNVVDNIVSRRWAMLWHFLLSGTGLLLSLYFLDHGTVVYCYHQSGVRFFIVWIFGFAETQVALRKYSHLPADFVGGFNFVFIGV